MTNERFYPATERKNDYIIKNVFQVQLNKAIDHTKRKTVFSEGQILLGFKAYDTYSEQRGNYTVLENIYK